MIAIEIAAAATVVKCLCLFLRSEITASGSLGLRSLEDSEREGQGMGSKLDS
jgi:hypothetical protein